MSDEQWDEDRIWEYAGRRTQRYSGETKNIVRYEVSECMRIVLTEVFALRAEVEALRQQLAAQEWEPVEDYKLYGWLSLDRYVSTLANGGMLKVQYGAGTDKSKRTMRVSLPDDIRLCKRRPRPHPEVTR